MKTHKEFIEEVREKTSLREQTKDAFSEETAEVKDGI